MIRRRTRLKYPMAGRRHELKVKPGYYRYVFTIMSDDFVRDQYLSLYARPFTTAIAGSFLKPGLIVHVLHV